MKRNAIIRIVIWSITLFLLVAILCSILFGTVYSRRHFVSEGSVETMAPRKILCTLYVPDLVNVYSSPSQDASLVQVLSPGDFVEVLQLETVNGTQWAYIVTPLDGWVIWDMLETATSSTAVQETSAIMGLPESDEALRFDPNSIREIEIEWVAGDILIQPMDIDHIEIFESDVSDRKHVMVWKQKGSELSIDFCEENDHVLFFGVNTELSKDLTIYVPRDWQCDTLELDVASASVEANDLTIRQVEFDGASGIFRLNHCSIDQLDVDTASGDIRFTGTLDILDCDAASANVSAVFDNVPSRLAVDTMSGDLDLTLPEDAGFTVSMDAMSSHFDSEFETTLRNNDYVCGDGSCRINVSAMSGDVTIRKAPGA